MQRPTQVTLSVFAMLGMSLGGAPSRADVVTDWKVKAIELVVEAMLVAPPAHLKRPD